MNASMRVFVWISIILANVSPVFSHQHHKNFTILFDRNKKLPPSPQVLSLPKGAFYRLDNYDDCKSLSDAYFTRCQCCIARAAENFAVERNDILFSQNIVHACSNTTSLCSMGDLQGLERGSTMLNSFADIYSRITVIKQMTIPSAYLEEDGTMVRKHVGDILALAHVQRKLDLPDFTSASCISIDDIASEKGGSNTIQLFNVKSTCLPKGAVASRFIVKESYGSLTEAVRLKSLLEIDGMKSIALPSIQPGYPGVALPIVSLAYYSVPPPHHDSRPDDAVDYHYIEGMCIFSVLPIAPGSVFADLILQYADSQTFANYFVLQKAFHAVGVQLSNFYGKFASGNHTALLTKGRHFSDTICHGDLHVFNMLFDPSSNLFSLIDNNHMATCRGHPFQDLFKLAVNPFKMKGKRTEEYDTMVNKIGKL